jgi:hypothetical protein
VPWTVGGIDVREDLVSADFEEVAGEMAASPVVLLVALGFLVERF